MEDKFLYKKFKDIDLTDKFFDSLKNDYSEFECWFNKKANNDEKAYIQTVDDKIEGFLYLKIEDGPITDVEPNMDFKKIVKIGTMKIDAHGTRLGERFIKKSLDFAIKNDIKHLYVTVFEKHRGLINLYEKYGFVRFATKNTGNGEENVLLKSLEEVNHDFRCNYPIIDIQSNAHLLGIYPKYHTRLFPDSILNNEANDIVEDVSHTNSIEKIYISKIEGTKNLQPGDLLVIYRTNDYLGPAKYRAVATSICTVDEVKSNKEFSSFEEYKEFCKNYSIFSEDELREFYSSWEKYYAIKMTYNIALPRRITRNELIQNVGLNQNAYWGFFDLTQSELEDILRRGNVSRGYINI
ncbi:GNAT family N-acetyltransferase [Paraclostridium sordellii]|uniref:GNAT family N-acetyltransferase n=1 Tax=Paraclostridium sordellii TaxID=1505 RepID=UPI0005DADAB7|nr:GNAT family N-acetyltransferase [Paeniclostridium sordellii]CEP42800.1 Uncharacterised protein [[Clostridium] sordellii] [Paeniclostridium sordellii]